VLPWTLEGLGAALFEAAPDPTLIVHQDGSIWLANRRAAELFGWTTVELQTMKVEALVPDAFQERHRKLRGEYHRTPRVREMGAGLELSGRRKDGSEVPVEISLSPLDRSYGHAVICVIRDVTNRRELERELRYQSTHDAFTGLFNRRFFQAECDRLKRGRGKDVAVVIIDVDGLKEVNDTLGHAAGDAHLKRLAQLLQSSFRAEDVVARLGGDEFAVLLPGTGPDQLTEAVARLRRRVAEASSTGDHSTELSVSVGGAAAAEASSLDAAIAAADEAMYEDKRARRRRRKS
jgi:diguanylate cyclase (GGDEF)-like protein/PAS domain S-box-containing protein